MAVKRTGLGKGLDSMIPPKATQRAVKEDKNTVSKTGETILKINEVEPNKKQPRKFFNEEALQELSDSIKQHGIVQPVLASTHSRCRFRNSTTMKNIWQPTLKNMVCTVL